MNKKCSNDVKKMLEGDGNYLKLPDIKDWAKIKKGGSTMIFKKKVVFKFELGDEAKDKITGFTGIIVVRSQWLNNCHTYGLQPKQLKDGIPQEKHSFDEPQLDLVKKEIVKPKRKTGGPERFVHKTTKM